MRTAVVVAMQGSLLIAAMASAQEAAGAAPGQVAGPVVHAVTPAEQVKTAQAVVARGARLGRRVGDMLAEARREADMIRLGCLNDKLTQVNANLRNAQKRAKAVEEALDAERRQHEYTVVLVLRRRFDVLDQEANQCVGQELYEPGMTRVTTEIDPSRIPDEDPSLVPVVAPPDLPATPPPVLTGETEPPPPVTPQM